MSRIEMVSSFKTPPLPGVGALTTAAAKEIATRPQFRGGIGSHVYVNGFDLARVEAEAYERGRKSGRVAAPKRAEL